MPINRKTLGISLIVVGLILIVVIIYFGFLKQPATSPAPVPAPTTTQTLPRGPVVGTTTPSDVPRCQQYDLSQGNSAPNDGQ